MDVVALAATLNSSRKTQDYVQRTLGCDQGHFIDITHVLESPLFHLDKKAVRLRYVRLRKRLLLKRNFGILQMTQCLQLCFSRQYRFDNLNSWMYCVNIQREVL